MLVIKRKRMTDVYSDILTTIEAARYVRLGKPTLERFRLTGEGPIYAKLGGAVRYRRVDLDCWLESRLTRSTSDCAA
jgi:excisionase family DNA binding protein